MHYKIIIKRMIDIIMTVLLLFLMGYQFFGDRAHEYAGAALFLCFIVHHILNINWYKAMFRGKYYPVRIYQSILNSLLLMAMIGLMWSGILLSRHVFVWISLPGKISVARLVHMVSAYWGFIFMAMHIGLHLSMICKNIQVKNESIRKVIKIIGYGIAVYGIYAFFKRNIVNYLFLKTQFVFFDFMESKVLFYVDYLSIVILFVLAADWLWKILKAR